MLFYDIENDQVYRLKDNINKYESFTPTVDNDHGYLLYYTYTTYDSFSSSNEIRYEVVDLYPTLKDAEIQGHRIKNYYFEDLDVNYADDRKVYPLWNSWGYSLQKVYISYIEVKNKKNFQRKQL